MIRKKKFVWSLYLSETLQLLLQPLKKHPPLLLLNQSNKTLKPPQQLQPCQTSNNLNQNHSRSNCSQYLNKLFIYSFYVIYDFFFLRFKCSSCITFTHQIWRYFMSLSSLELHLFVLGTFQVLIYLCAQVWVVRLYVSAVLQNFQKCVISFNEYNVNIN